MIKLLLKHLIYEICIDVFFKEIYKNFVLPKVVNYIRRIIRSNYTLEAQRDIAQCHGADIEKELLDAMSREIQQEIDRDILSHLTEVATSYELVGVSMVANPVNDNCLISGNWVND